MRRSKFAKKMSEYWKACAVSSLIISSGCKLPLLFMEEVVSFCDVYYSCVDYVSQHLATYIFNLFFSPSVKSSYLEFQCSWYTLSEPNE